MQPPKGYYKQILPPDLSHVRLAFANVPRHGVDEVSPEPVLAVLDASQDEHAAGTGQRFAKDASSASYSSWDTKSDPSANSVIRRSGSLASCSSARTSDPRPRTRSGAATLTHEQSPTSNSKVPRQHQRRPATQANPGFGHDHERST